MRFSLHIDRSETTVSDGTADSASKSKTRVKLETAELLGLNGRETGLQVDGGHCDRCEERVGAIG